MSRSLTLAMPEPGRRKSRRLFFPGCTLPALNPRQTVAIDDVLRRHFSGVGALLQCCGVPADALGMADEAAHAREELLRHAEAIGAEELLVLCPSCVVALRSESRGPKVTSVWEALAGSWEPPRHAEGAKLAVHDPCRARHDSGLHDAVRTLVHASGAEIDEVAFGRERTRCCGFGGAMYPVDPALSRRFADRRAAESARPYVTPCAGCRTALASRARRPSTCGTCSCLRTGAPWRRRRPGPAWPGTPTGCARSWRSSGCGRWARSRGVTGTHLVVVIVDGRSVEAREGSNLLDTLEASGFRIPRLCHDPRVAPTGSCGLCVVSRKDHDDELVLACESRVEAGMEVDTSTPAVAGARARRLAALPPTHALECPTCERHGDCRLEDLVHLLGALDQGPMPLLPRPPREESWPLIVHDPSRCVACGLCERLCAEAMGVGAIELVESVSGSRVVTVSGDVLSCEFCGQCVDACPVAALAARPDATGVPAWQREVTSTTCSGCSCGCQLSVESHDGELIRVRGVGASDPDRGNLCVRGRYAWDLLRAPGRLTSPLMRRGGRLVEATWDEALAATAQALRAARAQRESVAAIGSTRLTDEDAYVLQRFMRSVVGSPHVGAGPDAGIRALVDGMGAAAGVPASSVSFGDLGAADVVLVLRGDVGRSHPMVKNLLVQRAARGRRVFEAYATAGGVTGRRTGHLQVAPGGEEALLLWLARDALRRRAWVSGDCAHRPGFTQWCTALEAIDEDMLAGRGRRRTRRLA